MIITVTMNPAIDKTVYIGEFVHGGLNRIENIVLDAGGKGINVSKTIGYLGGRTVATGFLGGNNGKTLQMLMKDFNMDTDFMEICEETRINTKVVEKNGNVTELNEQGPVIREEHLHTFMNKLLQYADEDVWFVLSGSVPAGVPKHIYRDIILKVHDKGAKVFLDADGELFAHALEANPDIIKPNRTEIETYIGSSKRLSELELWSIGETFIKQGIGNVIISLGDEGAMFLFHNQKIKAKAVPVDVQSTVGAGDALVAAFVYGMSEKMSFEQCVNLSIATSAGAVTTVGTKPPEIDTIRQLQQKVMIEEIKS